MRRLRATLVATLVALASLRRGWAAAGSARVPFPQFPNRVVHDLSGVWDFAYFDDLPLPLSNVSFVQYNDVMVVPGSFDANGRYAFTRGTGVYRTVVQTQPQSIQLLKFEACSLWCSVWVDGTHVGDHAMGYSAFWLSLPPTSASVREVVVVADNRFNATLNPLQWSGYDFYQYGGVTRRAYLHEIPLNNSAGVSGPGPVGSSNTVYLQNIFVRAIDLIQGRVNITASVATAAFAAGRASQSAYPTSLTFAVQFDTSSAPTNVSVSGANGQFELGAFAVPNFRVWAPSSPNLHTVTVSVTASSTSGALAVPEVIVERFGMRTVGTFSGRLLLNNEPIRLFGYNRHDIHPDFGMSVPLSQRLLDLQILRDMGGNYIRGCHYPQDPDFLQLCDEMGILVWQENIQYKGSLPLNTPAVVSGQLATASEMLLNTRNHPSIIINGFLNEGPSDQSAQRPVYQSIAALLRSLDDSRPVTYASDHGFNDLNLDLVDIVSFNSYPAWYAPDTQTPAAVLAYIVPEFESEAQFMVQTWPSKPLLKSETGAGAIPGWHDSFHFFWTEEFQAEVLSVSASYLAGALNGTDGSRFTGTSLWQFYDTRTYVGPNDVGGGRPRAFNNKGSLDEYRRPKFGYYAVQSVWLQYWDANPHAIECLVCSQSQRRAAGAAHTFAPRWSVSLSARADPRLSFAGSQ